MQKQIEEFIKNAIISVFSMDYEPIEVEIPLREEHGDFSTPTPLKLSSLLSYSSLELANKLKEFIIKSEFSKQFEAIKVAQPGFINFYLKKSYYFEVLKQILEHDYFARLGMGEGKKVQVEFVSANPTGPLHIAHGRGAVIGDVTARILEHLGYEVQKEYYVNDTGGQIEKFAKSIEARYDELTGKKVEFPSDGYHGTYVIDMARNIMNNHSLDYLTENKRVGFLMEYAVGEMLKDHKEVLSLLNINHDNYFKEKYLVDSGLVDEVLTILKKNGYLEEKDGAIWFTSTDLGDDKDRVLVKSDKSLTYFIKDIAYHYEKFVKRGFDIVIDVWGADHHNHVTRIKNSLKSLNINPDRFEVILIQLVRLISKGKEILMSKRSGEFITLRELIEEVGKDVARYIYLTRSSNSPLDFDLDLALKESMDNPVFYIQYAYVRAGSILKQAAIKGIEIRKADEVNYALLSSNTEFRLLRLLSILQDEILLTGIKRTPHRLATTSRKLAEAFHEFYQLHKVIGESAELEQARLHLVIGTRSALELLLNLMGITKVEEM
ncbi:MAG: Arginine--tRNA ligase [candidate division WS2 bacterium]|uniref:Arginine--tRNA ligase n=1 Tax=Psychracetigena formicireducens TaxID=2986056 RepID=A0A9E2BGD7_PSYF1|nr:Arginine--tRNA ligase [Candidatus Psychracetigena formicireducens]MBT9144514.1 Arginine--tRNA ligase [Candidatus Psychracetigena formicireducens]